VARGGGEMKKRANGGERFSFANRDHLSAFVGLLYATGALCPKCGWGTRATSKRWSRCRKCDERVARIPLSDVRVESAK
jgi:hypothetical protein